MCRITVEGSHRVAFHDSSTVHIGWRQGGLLYVHGILCHVQELIQDLLVRVHRNGNFPTSFQIPYPGCLRVFDNEVFAVLQLVARNGCHKFNHGKVASPLFPNLLLVLLDVLHI